MGRRTNEMFTKIERMHFSYSFERMVEASCCSYCSSFFCLLTGAAKKRSQMALALTSGVPMAKKKSAIWVGRRL